MKKKAQISYMSDMSRSSTMDFNLEHIVSSVAFFASQAWDLANCKLHTRRFLHVQWLKQKTCQFLNFKHKIKKQHEYSKVHHISKSEQFQTNSCNLPTTQKRGKRTFSSNM